MFAISRPGAVRLLRDCACWDRPRSILRSVTYAALVILASFAIDRSAFVVDGAVLTDGHALASLELAMARAYCGQPSSFSNTVRIPYDVGNQIGLRHLPLRELVVRKAGSIDAYCRSVNVPFVNNENSLMLLETAILRVWPSISVFQLGEALHLIQIAGVSMFVLLLIDLGGSLALGVATIRWSLSVLRTMPTHVYSNYPFLFVMVLAAAAFYGFALKYRWGRRPIGLVLLGATAGVLSAFIVNMRTSYMPIALLFFVCFLLAERAPDDRSPGWRKPVARSLVLAGCFGLGYVALQWGMITRFLQPERSHIATHTLGHPLVLSIAVPENDLSRQLGIAWLDEVGRQKALGVDPQAEYLGPRYDRALLQYYRNLWKEHPREMLGLYRLKFSAVGMDMLAVLRGSPGMDGRLIRLLLAPISYAPNGLWLLGLYVSIVLGSLVVFVKSGNPLAFTLGLLSLAACLAHIEAGTIYSLFVSQYHNYLAFYVVFLSLVGLQAAVNLGRHLVLGSLPF